MQIGVVCLILSVSVAASAAILGNIFGTIMVGELNRQRDDQDQMSYFGYYPQKVTRIFREYRKLYPDGRYDRYTYICFALTSLGIVAAFISLFYIA